MENTLDLIYKVELLEDLIENQTKQLDTANLIIQAKNRIIELCEEEAELYKKQNNRLHKTIFWLSVCLGASAMISFLSYVL
jgi:hypothetical protein